jgi:membrane protein
MPRTRPLDRKDTDARHGNERGRNADRPTRIPLRGWWDVFARTRKEVKADNVSLLSAGVAYYALFALVPALVALVSLYGLLANPEDVTRQVSDILSAAPSEVRDLVETQLRSITEGNQNNAWLGVVVGVAVALWSASSGMSKLVAAINLAYDEEETRGFIRQRAVALALTIGAIVFLVVSFAIVAFTPSLLEETGFGDAGRMILNILRWPLLAGGLLVGLAILYRYGPDRDPGRWRWVSPGALVATVLWIAGSLLFSLYTANFGKYNETYGSLGAVVVLMLWLYLTGYSIVFGAELNAEIERQTRRDTTEGRERPLGQRAAHAADTVGPTASEIRGKTREHAHR